MTELAGKQRTIGWLTAVAGLVGLATVIAGTFAPWVNSGSVGRNLYRMTGIAARIGLLGPDSPAASIVPLLGPVCVLPVLLAVLGARRTAAILALVVALGCGGFAATAIILAGGRSMVGVSLALTGPVLVLVGSALVLVAATSLLVHRARRPPGRQISEIGTDAIGNPSH